MGQLLSKSFTFSASKVPRWDVWLHEYQPGSGTEGA
jgi:hypothetical protein